MRRRPVRFQGAAIIEFALVLPILLILFFGIVEFATALFDKAVITNASREAARSGIVYVSPTAHVSDATIRSIALQNCANLISYNNDAVPVVTITRTTSPDFPEQLLTVEIDYSYTGLGLGAMLTSITGPLVLSASTTMKDE
ncbi:MAG TPA: TadE family protein [Moraxellaceae bacterium]|nr:TadE family protein [Moraxellaceae bacterium]